MTEMETLAACASPPSETLLRAVDEFNRGEWHESHETLEDLWIGSSGEIRAFYQGFLQIAVALYHWQHGNFKGACILLESGTAFLRQVRAECQGIRVAAMVEAADRFKAELVGLGPQRMAEVPPSCIPRMVLAPGEETDA